MQGSQVLEKILGGNKRFLQGERTGVCNPVDVDLDDAMHKAVDAMVWFTMSRILERSPAIAAAVNKGELLLKGPVCSLQTGEVTILEEEG